MTAYAVGASTNTFLRTFVNNFIMPLIGKIIKVKQINNLYIGEFHIGPIIGDFIYWLLVIVILFIMIEYIFTPLKI